MSPPADMIANETVKWKASTARLLELNDAIELGESDVKAKAGCGLLSSN